jgi:hypothetical protein
MSKKREGSKENRTEKREMIEGMFSFSRHVACLLFLQSEPEMDWEK